MEQMEYGEWSVFPDVIEVNRGSFLKSAIWRKITTKHEGEILYFKLWNFWVRAGALGDMRSEEYFRDYEKTNTETDDLLKKVGFPWKKAETEEEVWERIGKVWNWLKGNVHNDSSEYSTISSMVDSWPSILDYAQYYASHGNLVWAACFSKAHLFATILGRMIHPRYRLAIAQCHHTENNAPPTASHVYVAAYVAEQWYYLDPTAVILETFPAFSSRKSIGVGSFTTVDYEHPYGLIPVPLSGFPYVPYLPK